MGFFTSLEQSTEIYNPIDDNTNDTVDYPDTASYTRNLHIIRRNEIEVEVLGGEIADFEVNPTGDLTAIILPDAKLVQGDRTYKVVDVPEYLPLIKMTKILLTSKISGDN